jgi:O-antigen/teichoic acid export membrane protein
VLTGMGRIGAYTRLHVIWALANVALSLALIGPLGLEGVALGSVLPLVVLEPLYLRIALRETGVSPRAFVLTAIVRPYGCAALAALVPLAVLVALGPTIAAAVVGTAAYLALYGALTLSRGLHREQRGVLRRMIPTPGV